LWEILTRKLKRIRPDSARSLLSEISRSRFFKTCGTANNPALVLILFKVVPSGIIKTHLLGSVADPDPGSSALLAPGSDMNNPDHISECLETIFWVKILKFFDADPTGMEIFGSRI
jgi:hypothetical protein